MIHRLKNKSFQSQVDDIDLLSLEEQRVIGDLIHVFKIFK